MRHSMVRLAAAAAVMGLASRAGAMPEHEPGHMSLKFEKGKTYVFKVNVGGDASGTLRPTAGTPEAEKNEKNQKNPADQPKREDGTRPAGDTARGQPASAISANQAIDYRIQVKEVTGDETTLLVNVDRSQPTSGAATLPKTPAGAPAGERSDKSDKGEKGIGGVAFGTYTVIVDKNGHVKTDAEPSRGAAERSDGEKKNPGRADEGKGSSIESSSRPLDDMLRMHIAIISGCGLHEKALKPGEIYSKDSAKDSEKSGAAAGSSPSTRSASSSSSFAALKLRYEGPTKRGNKELARFSILADASPANPSSPRAGSANEPKPGEAAREEKSGTERGSALSKDTLGEALFSMDDGILETLRLDGSKGALASSMGRLTIDRQSQDDKTKLGN